MKRKLSKMKPGLRRALAVLLVICSLPLTGLTLTERAEAATTVTGVKDINLGVRINSSSSRSVSRSSRPYDDGYCGAWTAGDFYFHSTRQKRIPYGSMMSETYTKSITGYDALLWPSLTKESGKDGEYTLDISMLSSGTVTTEFKTSDKNGKPYHWGFYSGDEYRTSWWETALCVVPMEISMKVPANSTLEVDVGLKEDSSCLWGEYMAFLVEGDCNKTCTEETVTPASTAAIITDGSNTIENCFMYLHGETDPDFIVGSNCDPNAFYGNTNNFTGSVEFEHYNSQWVKEYTLKSGVTVPSGIKGSGGHVAQGMTYEEWCGYLEKNDWYKFEWNNTHSNAVKTLTFVNNTNSDQTFRRYYCYYFIHSPRMADKTDGFVLLQLAESHLTVSVTDDDIRWTPHNNGTKIQDESKYTARNWSLELVENATLYRTTQDPRGGAFSGYTAVYEAYQTSSYWNCNASVTTDLAIGGYNKIGTSGAANSPYGVNITTTNTGQADQSSELKLQMYQNVPNTSGTTTDRSAMLVVPVCIHTTVPAGQKISVTYDLKLEALPGNGDGLEYVLGLANPYRYYNWTPTVTDRDGNGYNSYFDVLTTGKYQKFCMNGRSTTNSLAYISHTLTQAQSDAVKNNPTAYAAAVNSLYYGWKSADYTVTYELDNSGSSGDQVFNRWVIVYMMGTSAASAYPNRQLTGCLTVKQVTSSGTTNFYNESDATEEEIQADSIQWTNLRDDTLATLKALSDQDYHTAKGWGRLMAFTTGTVKTRGDFSMKNIYYFDNSGAKCYLVPGYDDARISEMSDTYKFCDGKQILTDTETSPKMYISTQISDAVPTLYQNSYGYPLYGNIKYAWMYNGTTSVNGAVGYDYVRPIADITPKVQSYKQQDSEYNNGTGDFDSFLIKYAGDVDGKPTYFVALEGTDGQRRLLVKTYNVVGTDETYREQVVFITAAEYDAHPELYQTAYGWPSGTKYVDGMTDADATIHSRQGQWVGGKNTTTTNGQPEKYELNNEALNEEVFRVSISGNLQWKMITDLNYLFYGFTNKCTVDADSIKDGTLYQFYETKKNSTEIDGQMLKKYEPEITNCINKLTKGTPETVVGLTYRDNKCYLSAELNWQNPAGKDENGKFYRLLLTSSFGFGLSASTDRLFGMGTRLGLYLDNSETNEIVVGEGETLIIAGKEQITAKQTLIVAEGGTLQVQGTLINYGTINCYGTMRIESGGLVKGPSNLATYGKFNFVDGTLIISTNGIFDPGHNKNDAVKFTSSAVYNDGLFLAASGFHLTDSIFENNASGIVTIGAGLRKDTEVNSVLSLAQSMPRGMPESNELLKYGRDILLFYGEIIKGATGKAFNENINKMYLTGTSYYCNNGVTFNLGGIRTDSNTSVIFGNNQFIYYGDMVYVKDVFDYRQYAASCGFLWGWNIYDWGYMSSGVNGTFTSMAKDLTTWYNKSQYIDDIDNTRKVTVAFGTYDLDAALAEGKKLGWEEWSKAYNNATGDYTKPKGYVTITGSGKSSGGGC